MFIIIMVEELSITGLIEKEEDRMKIQPNSVIIGDISQEIRNTEEYCRIKFPDSYINFIKKYNVMSTE